MKPGCEALGMCGLSLEASILQLHENGDGAVFLRFCFVITKKSFKILISHNLKCHAGILKTLTCLRARFDQLAVRMREPPGSTDRNS